ncbi:MarR family winged helix-turn-helix transcriptional regulator [Roseitranquillus sediminis]|uniref:MarR family winged helix-turn-helix transcriptional regulator n=1 Tax=Roseitranquillus sediminis TaxID=2809051 RepID=UPI001D0CCA19|nr:MarR family transcriptional regulator [Roseitranquillus sediminis]MBM9593170.1 MarR family transcriptional regulator [Roseitranquillus sediminis]
MSGRESVEREPGRIGLGLLLRRAHKSFSGALAARLERVGITHAQFHHLRRLNEQDGVSSSELSALVEVKKATSTSILDALETKGLIRRDRDATDRRRVNVFLTAKGRELQGELAACAVEVNDAAARDLSPEERAQLFDLLERMIASLSAEWRPGRED